MPSVSPKIVSMPSVLPDVTDRDWEKLGVVLGDRREPRRLGDQGSLRPIRG
jgi:hypothetical protein